MILVVDDDRSITVALQLMLECNGYEVATASTPAEAMAEVRARVPQLVIMDMNFSRATSGEEGLTLLRQVKLFCESTPVILITAWGSIPLAVEGMKLGAFDFITKPWDNGVLLGRIKTALALNCDHSEVKGHGAFERGAIIGHSAGLEDVLRTVERVAPTDASVLIMGENGTGKELIAEALHANSGRAGAPFVKVNLGGISQSLFESEMFGHKKGAFTGAVSDRTGRFEMADGGTIFLDEIGDLDKSCQVKLLRVLQEQQFERLGESRTRRINVRVVCATNADLPAMVSRGEFREDLFYRINLITVKLPPLRERRDDIPVLVRHFARMLGGDKALPAISDGAMRYLASLPYPGNIRELKNLVQRTIIVAGDKDMLEEEDFRRQNAGTPAMPSGDVTGLEGMTLEEMECRAIEAAIKACDGNLSRVGLQLGITRQSLYRRMEKYGINPDKK